MGTTKRESQRMSQIAPKIVKFHQIPPGLVGAPGINGKKRPAPEPRVQQADGKRQLGIPFNLGRPGELAPVHLDVGGRHYTTSLATLKAVPGSRIYNTFTGRVATVLDKKTNCYFIDRDGDLFRYVLEYLRNGALVLPDDFKGWEQLAP